ncbi:Small integral membrane protein 20 [Bulinus truncatus]|nr:Small integral membrane protein 20 [Bulinus truncatus]
MLLTTWRCFSQLGDASHNLEVLLTTWRCFSQLGDASHNLEVFLTTWRTSIYSVNENSDTATARASSGEVTLWKGHVNKRFISHKLKPKHRISKMNYIRHNLRSVMMIGTVVGGIFVATYPIIISPYLNPKPWKQEQSIGRRGIDREKIQPGGMKVWTDPFDKSKD